MKSKVVLVYLLLFVTVSFRIAPAGATPVAPPNLMARCIGGIFNPSVFIEWTPRPHVTNYVLQKGDATPQDPDTFWGYINNDETQVFHVDRNVNYGDTYSYRIKYDPNTVSDTGKATIDEGSCGLAPADPGEIIGRCVGGIQSPHVVLEWAPTSQGQLNRLQRGQHENRASFWTFLNNNPNYYSYSDYLVDLGETYFYRVKLGPNLTTTTVKVVVNELTCSNDELPQGYLTGYCEGGSNPRVVLRWGKGDPQEPHPVNSVQRAQLFPVPPGGTSWSFLNNDPAFFKFIDNHVKMGNSYVYRVKYSPSTPSNEFKIRISPRACGCAPDDCP
ncbi:MAG: hypothetical protein IT289_07665 [Oligoflexia bacterium]|nr:hypothetical protein [Oligoflexia bacterium]